MHSSVGAMDATLTEVKVNMGGLQAAVHGVAGGMTDMQATMGGMQTQLGGVQAAVGVVGGAVDSLQASTSQELKTVQQSLSVRNVLLLFDMLSCEPAFHVSLCI